MSAVMSIELVTTTQDLVEVIAAEIRTLERFDARKIQAGYSSVPAPDFRRMLWSAQELLQREEGIVFGPVRGHPYNYERKAWQQIEKRAHRQRAAGTRKHQRAESKLRIAAELAPDEAKDRIRDAADRVALRAAMAAAREI